MYYYHVFYKPCNTVLLFCLVCQRNWDIKIYFAYLPPCTNFMLCHPFCRTDIISQQLDEIPLAFLVVLAVKSLTAFGYLKMSIVHVHF